MSGSQICVDHFAESIENYVYGHFSKAEIIDFWSCLDNSVQLFNKYVRGNEVHRFHRNELRSFLQQYFITDRKISDDFLIELMRLKTLLLGGDIEYILKPELTEVSEMIADAKQISLDLFPYISVLNIPFQDSDYRVNQSLPVDKAIQVLTDSFRKIGQMLSKHQVDYQFSHLSNVLDHFDEFLTYEDPLERFKQMSVYVPLIAQFKGLMLGTDSEAIYHREWVDLFRLAAQAYGLTVRFEAYIKDSDITTAEPLRQVNLMVLETSQLFREGLDKHDDKKFSHLEIQGLLASLPETDILPDDFEADSILATWKIFVDKIVADGIPNSDGFTHQHLTNVLKEYDQWFSLQNDINNIFANPVSLPSCAAPLLNFESNHGGYEEMKRITDCAPWAVKQDEEYRLHLNYNIFNHIPERFPVSNINWQRVFVRLLIKAYASDSHRAERRTGLTQNELGKVYRDLKPLLVAIDLVDKDDQDYYKEIFRDAKFFMPQSNGNDIIEFEEGVEYFYGAISATEVTLEMVEGLKKACPYQESMGSRFGAPFINGACARNHLGLHFGKYYSHLPEMVKYQKTLSSKQWQKLLDESFVAMDMEEDELTDLSQARLAELSGFFQYVETFMIRFDHNQNGKVAGSELSDALDEVVGAWSAILGPGAFFLSYDRGELISLFADLKWMVE